MKAIAVLRHALRMLLGNFSAALRVSAVLFVVLQVLKVLERQSLLDGNNAELMEQSVLQVLIGLLASICGIVAMSWIAVAWHRFVLLGERPVLLPRLHLGRMWAYLGRGLQAALFPALAVGVIGLFFYLLILQLFRVEITRFVPREVTRALLTMLMIYLFLRFGTVLAGVALRPGLTLVEGWNATKGEGVVFGLLALCLFFVFSLGGIMTQRGGDGPIAWVAHAVWEWGYTMFYLSVLTTLYGHYTEKRAL